MTINFSATSFVRSERTLLAEWAKLAGSALNGKLVAKKVVVIF